MSRTMFALIALGVLSGCQHSTAPRNISLVTARLATLGPHWSYPGCDDCVPHRPWTHKYWPEHDYKVTQRTAQVCAFRALSSYRQNCGGRVSHDFKMGFISAYEDLALNRKPVPPIYPPPKYWNAFYRSCGGRQAVQDWFAGYDAGLDMGYNSGVSRFHEIYLRRGGCNRGSSGQCGADSSPMGNPQPGPAYQPQYPAFSWNKEWPNSYSAEEPNPYDYDPVTPVSGMEDDYYYGSYPQR